MKGIEINRKYSIEVVHLHKYFELKDKMYDSKTGISEKKLHALKDIHFALEKGESLGVVGPNGSGKSTLLKILARVTKPSSGYAVIQGKVASILDIGAGFHPHLSGKENIFLNGQLLGFSKKEILKKHDKIVEFSGIEKFLEEPVKNYSNGMFLRLAFSIMANLDFDIYLLDEVMGVGDAEFQKQTFYRLKEIISSGKTCLYASHNLFELKLLFDKFLYINEGEMEILSAEEVSKKILKIPTQILKIQPQLQHETVEITQVEMITKNENQILYRNETVDFEFTYNVLQHTKHVEFAVRLKKDAVPFGFFSEKFYLDSEASTINKSVLKIPANILNSGFYHLDIFGGIDSTNFSYMYDCMCFEIHPHSNQEKISVNEPIVIQKK